MLLVCVLLVVLLPLVLVLLVRLLVLKARDGVLWASFAAGAADNDEAERSGLNIVSWLMTGLVFTAPLLQAVPRSAAAASAAKSCCGSTSTQLSRSSWGAGAEGPQPAVLVVLELGCALVLLQGLVVVVVDALVVLRDLEACSELQLEHGD